MVNHWNILTCVALLLEYKNIKELLDLAPNNKSLLLKVVNLLQLLAIMQFTFTFNTDESLTLLK